MDNTTPLALRCLALTGTFETGHLPPECFSAIGGDSDGQGLSFSAMQWNLGQKTLQPLLSSMFTNHPDLMRSCFGDLALTLQGMLLLEKPSQLAWARSTVNDLHHQVALPWKSAFAKLGATPQWQNIATAAANGFFDHAKGQAYGLKVKSDRGIALLFDIAVQCGSLVPNSYHRVVEVQESMKNDATWGESALLRCIAEACADSVNPRWRMDTLTRKMTIANGVGEVHGLHFDLAKQFGL